MGHQSFEAALLEVNRLAARDLLMAHHYANGLEQTIDQLIVPALDSIGSQWEKGEIALSQVYMSGRICEQLVDELLPPGQPARADQPRIALAVLEDPHLLGKRIVHSAVRASGIAVLDYDRVTVGECIERVRRDGVEILLVSTLMLSSALRVAELRAALGEDVKIIVGGAPFRFDRHLWREVGADAFGNSATDAAALVRRFWRKYQ